MAALLLMAAEPMSAIDAERAFAADAQKLGQWTAFRKYAAEDAVMFVPEQVNAQAWLKDKKDPPVSVFWWPGRSHVSCDGNFAINTGPWIREWGKSVGYFTTIWKRQPDGSWKWLLDHGDALPTARAEGGDVRPIKASCAGKPPADELVIVGPASRVSLETGVTPRQSVTRASGRSDDNTLGWTWVVGADGARTFVAHMWTGERFETIVTDDVAAPPK